MGVVPCGEMSPGSRMWRLADRGRGAGMESVTSTSLTLSTSLGLTAVC